MIKFSTFLFSMVHVCDGVCVRYIILIASLRCVESGVSYLCSRVESIVEGSNGHSLIACEHGINISSRYCSIQVFSDGIHSFMMLPDIVLNI